MTNIEFIAEMDLDIDASSAKDIEVKELFTGPFRKILEVRLRNSGVLAKHSANVPITVLCLAGRGIFSAGPDLVDSQKLAAGTLITLEANVEHEVVADPAINLIVTKFQGN
jgi:quercetin dioxygenase-like cupin family protein